MGDHDSLSIRCDISNNDGKIDRVEFTYDGQTKTEYQAPYWARGDTPRRVNPVDYLRTKCPERKQVTVAGFIWSDHDPCFEETFELLPFCDGFNIQLDLTGVTSNAFESIFAQAADRWGSVVTGDLPPILDFGTFTALTTIEAQYGCTFPQDVDDVSICAVVAEIDGPSGPGVPSILGFAGPTFIRTASLLPISGIMVFDEADVGVTIVGERLKTTILHEMGHVLVCCSLVQLIRNFLSNTLSIQGIGTLWELLQITGSDDADCPYSTDSRAFEEYELISGCDTLPIELERGPGSRCGHWAEFCFGTELMTPALGNEAFSPLSQITAASLEDIGYEVSYDHVDLIDVEDLDSTCVCMSSGRHLQDVSSNTTEAPKSISAKAKAMAEEYGAKILASHTMAPEVLEELPDDVLYVGGNIGVVYVVEDGSVFEVVMTVTS